MADLTLEESQQKIIDLEKRLEQSAESVKELTSRASELDVVRAGEAKLKTEYDALNTQYSTAAEQLKELETTRQSLVALQESHTQLETRHTDSIKSRLQSFGLAEDKYQSRSLIELEAMESVLTGYIPPASSTITNPPANPDKIGTDGSPGDSGNNNNASPYVLELDEIDRARNKK